MKMTSKGCLHRLKPLIHNLQSENVGMMGVRVTVHSPAATQTRKRLFIDTQTNLLLYSHHQRDMSEQIIE
jgi:hypothetical protein